MPISKCIGHDYSNDGDEPARTLYLVLPENAITQPLAVGDILAGNQSHGFLENVVETNNETDGFLVHTELSKCDVGSMHGKRWVDIC